MSFTYYRTLFAVCAWAWLVFPLVAAASPKPSERQVAQWIKALGAADFATREKASRKLWLAGEVAEAALEKAVTSDDAEVVRRSRDLLDKFRWGIYPDMPAEIVARIRAYQSSEAGQRMEIVQKLLQHGSAGLHAVLKISRNEKDPNRRKVLGECIFRALRSAFAHVLQTNNYEPFETLLELGYDSAIIDSNQYAAYWLLRGKLDERIAHFRSLLAKTPTEKRVAETLAYLYRAKGDLKSARKVAEKAELDDLVEDILLKEADWKALAAHPTAMGTDPVGDTIYRATYARLSGNKKAFEAALVALKKQGREKEASRVALAFCANGRSSEGLSFLAEMEEEKDHYFMMLCDRLQYREAIALVARTSVDNSRRKYLELHLLRMLYWLGEQDKIRALFARLDESFSKDMEIAWSFELLTTEYYIGLKDRAFERCARVLKRFEESLEISKIYLSAIFPFKAEPATVWFQLLRQKFEKKSILAVLRLVRDLLDGKIARATVKDWIETAEKELGSLSREDQQRRQSAFAEVATAAGLDVLVPSLLEKADTRLSLIHLGDLLADKREWMRAAEYYRHARGGAFPARRKKEGHRFAEARHRIGPEEIVLPQATAEIGSGRFRRRTTAESGLVGPLDEPDTPSRTRRANSNPWSFFPG